MPVVCCGAVVFCVAVLSCPELARTRACCWTRWFESASGVEPAGVGRQPEGISGKPTTTTVIHFTTRYGATETDPGHWPPGTSYVARQIHG
jgi:hypothetical protein